MMIVEPAIAKTDHNSLFKKYIFIAIAAFVISCLLPGVLTGFLIYTCGF